MLLRHCSRKYRLGCRTGTPVLWDFVHTNEEGARLVAAAMLDSLRPKLEKRLAGAPS